MLNTSQGIFQNTLNSLSYLCGLFYKAFQCLSSPYFTSIQILSIQKTAHKHFTLHSTNSVTVSYIMFSKSTPHSAEDQRKCLESLRPSYSVLSTSVFSSFQVTWSTVPCLLGYTWFLLNTANQDIHSCSILQPCLV